MSLNYAAMMVSYASGMQVNYPDEYVNYYASMQVNYAEYACELRQHAGRNR